MQKGLPIICEEMELKKCDGGGGRWGVGAWLKKQIVWKDSKSQQGNGPEAWERKGRGED